MRDAAIDDLVLDEIVARWPQVLRVFIDWHLHCVVCPISRLHTLADAAAAHGYPIEQLREAVLRAIRDAPPPLWPPSARLERSAIKPIHFGPSVS